MNGSHINELGYVRNFSSNAITEGGVVNNYYGASAAKPARQYIPYPCNRGFVRRANLIAEIDNLLSTSLGARSAALCGLGGSGKTQLAIDYAYRRSQDKNCSIFWVHAENEATFVQSYRRIARLLDINSTLEEEILLPKVCDELSDLPLWVLVLDGADDLAMFGVEDDRTVEVTDQQIHISALGLQTKTNLTSQNDVSQSVWRSNFLQYIPTGLWGTVLWTTRDKRIAGSLVGEQEIVEVASMSIIEAKSLLANVRHEDNHSKTERDNNEEIALLEDLQRLPLAIYQAGSMMQNAGIDPSQYRSRLENSTERWRLLRQTSMDRFRRETPNSILEIWDITIDRIRRCDEVAYKLLNSMAYIKNEDIPWGLVEAIAAYKEDHGVDSPDEAALKAANEESDGKVRSALARLKAFSFLNQYKAADHQIYFRMHPLVQEALLYRQNAQDSVHRNDTNFGQVALGVMLNIFAGDDEVHDWKRRDKYITHGLQVTQFDRAYDRPSQVISLLDRLSTYLSVRQRWREVEPLQQKALALRKVELGDEHAETITCMYSLAATFGSQCRYHEAKVLEDQALRIRSLCLGEKHPDTISSRAQLAARYSTLGLFTDAERLARQVLEDRIKILGGEHERTLSSLHQLCGILKDRGDYEQALEIGYQTLGLRRALLPDMHHGILESLQALGRLCVILDRYDEAEGLYSETLRLLESSSIPISPPKIFASVLISVAYRGQGRFLEAEEIQRKALSQACDLFGHLDPSNLYIKGELFWTYRSLGRYEEAKDIQTQIYEQGKSLFGEMNIKTIGSLRILAGMHVQFGQYVLAVNLHTKALEQTQQLLGGSHPDTIATHSALGSAYVFLGNCATAEAMLLGVLEKCQKNLGRMHVTTLTCMLNVAFVYSRQGRFGLAGDMLLKILHQFQNLMGNEHRYILCTKHALADTYQMQLRSSEAYELMKSVQPLLIQKFGMKSAIVLEGLQNLANVVCKLGKYEEARDMLVQVSGQWREVFGGQHPLTLRCMHDLANVFYHQGLYEDAERIQIQTMEQERQVLGERHQMTVDTQHCLALTRHKLGRIDDAVVLMDQTLKLWQDIVPPDSAFIQRAENHLRSWKG